MVRLKDRDMQSQMFSLFHSTPKDDFVREAKEEREREKKIWRRTVKKEDALMIYTFLFHSSQLDRKEEKVVYSLLPYPANNKLSCSNAQYILYIYDLRHLSLLE